MAFVVLEESPPHLFPFCIFQMSPKAQVPGPPRPSAVTGFYNSSNPQSPSSTQRAPQVAPIIELSTVDRRQQLPDMTVDSQGSPVFQAHTVSTLYSPQIPDPISPCWSACSLPPTNTQLWPASDDSLALHHYAMPYQCLPVVSSNDDTGCPPSTVG